VLEALFVGQVIGGVWLAFIGWFLYNSATAGSQQAVMDQVLHGVAVADVMDEVPPSIGFTVSVQYLVFDHLLDGRHRAVVVQGPDGSLLGLVMLSDLRQVPQEDWPTTPVSRIGIVLSCD